jgi:hypothetical protein
MNRKTFLGLAMLAVAVAIGVGSAAAQNMVHATIPFGFNVGAKALPAGDYELQRLNGNIVAIRGVDAGSAALALTMVSEQRGAEGKATLVFNRYGQETFLSQILTPGEGRKLGRSKAERRAAAWAAESAENTRPDRIVYVAAAMN